MTRPMAKLMTRGSRFIVAPICFTFHPFLAFRYPHHYATSWYQSEKLKASRRNQKGSEIYVQVVGVVQKFPTLHNYETWERLARFDPLAFHPNPGDPRGTWKGGKLGSWLEPRDKINPRWALVEAEMRNRKRNRGCSSFKYRLNLASRLEIAPP